MTALDAFELVPRWVAWREEMRNGRPTKVPHSPHVPHEAKSDDPGTWNTRSAAEARARNLVNGHGIGGVGLVLGDLGDGTALGGVDLDTCRRDDGKFEEWALEVIERFSSYTEVSPSGTGAKIFFRYRTDDLPRLRPALGEAQYGRQFKRGNGKDHPPAIELYLSHRYFTATEQWLDTTPDQIATVGTDALLWLLTEAGPSFAGASPDGANSNGKSGRDGSRSAAALRKGAILCRAGKSYDEIVVALLADPETAEWARTKGQASGGREFRRIWDKAAPDNDALPTITVRAGLRHEAADAGLAALEAAGTAFYQRGEQIVRVASIAAKTADGATTAAPGIVPVTHAVLGRELGRAARWEGFDRKGDSVRVDPPRPIVEQIAEMAGNWPFPVLAGVIGTPTMRADGSLLLDEGYDGQTGLVLLGAPAMPPIPEYPTRADAECALLILDALLDEFPFKDGGGRELETAPWP